VERTGVRRHVNRMPVEHLLQPVEAELPPTGEARCTRTVIEGVGEDHQAMVVAVVQFVAQPVVEPGVRERRGWVELLDDTLAGWRLPFAEDEADGTTDPLVHLDIGGEPLPEMIGSRQSPPHLLPRMPEPPFDAQHIPTVDRTQRLVHGVLRT